MHCTHSLTDILIYTAKQNFILKTKHKEDQPYINIAHGCDNTRIYRQEPEGEFFSYTATRESIIPKACRSASEMAQHVVQMTAGTQCEANLTFAYPTTLSRKKKSKLSALMQRGITDFDVDHVVPWLMLLF